MRFICIRPADFFVVILVSIIVVTIFLELLFTSGFSSIFHITYQMMKFTL